MSDLRINLPLMYQECSPEACRKGEAYAKQVVAQGYPDAALDALSVLSAIIFEQQRRIERLMA